jgi:hypothetical protein
MTVPNRIQRLEVRHDDDCAYVQAVYLGVDEYGPEICDCAPETVWIVDPKAQSPNT